MKIKINKNDGDLWCLYSKEKIEIDDMYIETKEQYLDEEIIKTYAYWYLDALVTQHLQDYEEEPDIEIED